MRVIRDMILDAWSAISYKAPLAAPALGMPGATWMDPQSRRRLMAYQVLQAYTQNVARIYLNSPEADATADHREYGDAELVVQQTLSALTGDEQHILVEGAEDETADPAAVDRQEWLRQWATDERFSLAMIEAETDAVALGDGLYVVEWSAAKQRVRLRTVDPGFYFPVLDDGLADDYPTKVHLAWELEGDSERGIPRKLRRITYELGPIEGQTVVDTFGARVKRVLVSGEAEPVPLLPGDRFEGGRVVRSYPWNDAPSSVTCFLTDCEWDLDSLDARDGLNDLSLDRARFATNEDGELLDRLDLRIDFLPVVHLPNTVSRRQHFGTSSLARVLQLLDDLAATDTDLQAASSTTGSPPIGLAGAQVPTDADGRTQMTMGPGEVWNLGDNGKLSTVDTSPALAALGAYRESLLTRLSANARLPEAMLGRVSPADVPSGFAVAMTFGPLESMVRTMRLSRQEKYPLLLKMVQRLSLAAGVLDGPVLDAELEFGSYLPADEDAVIDRVSKLLAAGAISLETAVQMLVAAGVPVDDPAAEVDRIQSRAFAQANLLADATGDTQAVRDYLGLAGTGPDLTPAVPPGAIVLPTLPGTPNADPNNPAPPVAAPAVAPPPPAPPARQQG